MSAGLGRDESAARQRQPASGRKEGGKRAAECFGTEVKKGKCMEVSKVTAERTMGHVTPILFANAVRRKKLIERLRLKIARKGKPRPTASGTRRQTKK